MTEFKVPYRAKKHGVSLADNNPMWVRGKDWNTFTPEQKKAFFRDGEVRAPKSTGEPTWGKLTHQQLEQWTKDLEEYYKPVKINATPHPYGTFGDPVNHPSHYTQGEIECIDAIAVATTDLLGIEAVCTGNAIKYLWRWKQKGGKEDLWKAQWYLNRLIDACEA